MSVDTDDETISKDTPAIRLPNKSAIEAINNAAKHATGEILIVVSDDFDCGEYGWDERLLSELSGKSDFVLKTRDGIQPTLVTLPVVDRVWYERYGYIYHPGYKHLYADTDLTAVAHMTGRLIYSNLEFPHLHHTTGKTQKDEINERNDLTQEQGRLLFESRLVEGFGIADPVNSYESLEWHPSCEVLLSILIATTKSRAQQLAPLLATLVAQKTYAVEILMDSDEIDCIGKKRNSLLEAAKGEYVVFVDDDDKVPEYYVAQILASIGSKPDCIGINGTVSTDGWNFRKWYISKEYGHWFEKDGVLYRTPNHISPVRRELALMVRFPEISHGEDADFSHRLLPLLKTEVLIEPQMYYYDFRSYK